MVVSSSANEITGSWHNSGYHGHYRSRIRNDFMNEYRQRAKPQPPQKYIDRSRVPVRRHAFSTHDNRERYKDNALYFVDGNGRRQVHGSTVNYKPEFIAWMPHKAELIDKRQPLTSVYRDNFHQGVGPKTPSAHQQLYANKIASQAPAIRYKLDSKQSQGVFTDGYPMDIKTHFTTTYKKIHCEPDPRRMEAKEINTICYRSANSQKIERARSVGPSPLRESVASCMSWAVSRPKTAAPFIDGNVERNRMVRGGTEATPLIPANTTQSSAALPAVTQSMTSIAPAAQVDNTAALIC